MGTSIPRSPRATMTASEATMISSRFAIPDWSSIFEMIARRALQVGEQAPQMSTSSASRTKESAK